MVLLTVLAVGLLGLSSISLRGSSRGDLMAVARANARMALMIAIGELQKELGPDLRTSGTADLAASSTGAPLQAGAAPGNNFPPGATGTANKGLTAVQSGTRYWTGVWENANQINPVTTIYTTTPVPKHRKWLISGNEGSPVGSGVYTPANPQIAVGSSGAVEDPKKAVVLVGPGTVGDPGPGTNDRYVSAPLVEISDGTSSSGPSGRHGWWIGDEGVKAKLNLASSFENSDDATYPSLAAQRRGWESVDGFSNYPSPGTAGEESLPKLVSVSQAGLLLPGLNQGGGDLKGRAFHSATTESFGLLTDSLQGGLRLDMSSYMEQGLPGSAPTGMLNGIASNTNVIPRTISRNMKGPRWDRIKEFYDLGKNAKQTGKLTVTGATTTNNGAIAPIITEFRILCGIRLVRTGGDIYKVQPCAKIAIAIANPYPYPLEWTGGLDLEIKNETPAHLSPSSIWGTDPSTNPPRHAWEGVPQNNPAFLTADPRKPALFNQAIFRIPAGSLPAGEARAYTIAAPALRQVSSTVTQTVVNMALLRSSKPDDFNNCVILETSSPTVDYAKYPSVVFDVRENTVTSTCSLELRPAGSNSILRKIERLELDNARFDETKKGIAKNDAQKFDKPLPLQFYGFQLSQPGERYDSTLGDIGQLGLRGSTLRTYTDFNLQATRFRKPLISYSPPPFFMFIADNRNALTETAGETGPEFSRNLTADPMPWGYSRAAPNRTVLFSPPSELVSLGQLQHIDLTGDDSYASVGHQPGNAMGNSYASPFVPRAKTSVSRPDFTVTDFNNATSVPSQYYDISYMLNASLWDTYFLSTIPDSGPALPRNPAMVKINPEDQSSALHDPLETAGHLLVNGAHNVNSTDKDAWKALLGSSKHLKHPVASGSESQAIFPRSLEQLATAASPPTGKEEDSFAGYRKLDDTQLDALATELARQVRLRGPFVTISQFVNRSLVGLSQANLSDSKMLGRSGALQAALDISGINISPDGSKNPFTAIVMGRERLKLQPETTGSSIPRADLVGTYGSSMPGAQDVAWPTKSKDGNPGAIASILADKDMLSRPNLQSEQGFRSTGIPSWVTQADVLQVIGPVISARSDTFKVRAYGEALDPATGNPVARAWCEAIVQRFPEYVDGTDKITDRPSDLTPVNARFGRRFKTVSFKWLSPDEI